MTISFSKKDLENIVMIGDRVLIKPKSPQEKTKSGLFLPLSVEQKERLHCGYVVKIGPGFPIPNIAEYDEPWKKTSKEVKYIPVQPQEGDLAVYFQNSSHEILINNETYLIVSSASILMLFRDDGLVS